MKYKTCEFLKLPNIKKETPHGMRINLDYTDELVWDTITGLLLDGERYIHHVISCNWIENKDYPVYNYPGYTLLFGAGDLPQIIPCGDLIYTIKLYYEVEK